MNASWLPLVLPSCVLAVSCQHISLDAVSSDGEQGAVISREAASTSMEFPYPPHASHTFAYKGDFTTGLALSDVTGNGFKDIIVSNGNDMSPQPVAVYKYSRQSAFPRHPSWYSHDFDYHFALCMGDVNGDGLDDVVVTVAWDRLHDPADYRTPNAGGVKLYLGDGAAFQAEPAQKIMGPYMAMACALADFDGDGELDLAVATLVDPATEISDTALIPPGRIRLYRNQSAQGLGPVFETEPFWMSDPLRAADVKAADINDDGLMDLVVGAERTSVFFGQRHDTRFNSQPDWQAHDEYSTQYSIDVGRVGPGNGLAVVASAVGCNSPGARRGSPRESFAGCTSRYLLYQPTTGATRPRWVHERDDLVFSKLLLADLSGDGRLDLVTGAWTLQATGAPISIFRGAGNSFDSSPAFESQTTAVAQTIAVADLHGAEHVTWTERFHVKEGRSLFTLGARIIERIDQVEIQRSAPDGSEQRIPVHRASASAPDFKYHIVAGSNWISVFPALQRGDTLTVRYRYSTNLDIVVTNWLPGQGNLIFEKHLGFH